MQTIANLISQYRDKVRGMRTLIDASLDQPEDQDARHLIKASLKQAVEADQLRQEVLTLMDRGTALDRDYWWRELNRPVM